MSDHTPEPWELRSDFTIICADGLSPLSPKRPVSEILANEKRKVNCVNGCIGIEDPATTVPKLVAVCWHLIEALDDSAQYKGTFLRHKHGDDDLLAAARAVLAKTGKRHDPPKSDNP